MDWGFFKPSISRLVLPFLVVVYLIVLLVMSKSVIYEIGEQSCYMKGVFEEAERLRSLGDNTGLQRLQEESTERVNEFQSGEYKLAGVFAGNIALGKTLWFYPVPCLLMQSDFCMSYTSQEHYDCIEYLIENNGLEGIAAVENLEYKPFSYLPFIGSMVFIFVFIYLVLCAERWIFRKIWPKKDETADGESD